jgi:general secretion pathway protein A
MAMYCSFFGLREKPFNITPDPRFLFLSPSHQEALGHLLYGIEERKGFITITGEVGTGKTLLCRALLERLGQHVRTALIFNSFLSELDLLRSINEEFGIPYPGATRKDLIDRLNSYLIEEFRAGRNAVLIIDEAQNLAPPVLEQVRMLSNLETERGKLLQIILVGQPELRKQLARPDLRQLNQRIALRYHLQPFDRQETADYVNHRLLVAGSHGVVKFSRGALSAIARLSNGIPRTINLLSDRAMLAAYVHGSGRIERAHVRQAWRELQGQESQGLLRSGGEMARRSLVVTQGLMFGAALILGGTAWFGMYRAKPLEAPAAAVNRPQEQSASAARTPATAEEPPPSLREQPADSLTLAPDPPETPLQQTPPAPAGEGTGDGTLVTALLSSAQTATLPEVEALAVERFPGEVLLRALLLEYQRDPQQPELQTRAALARVASSFGLEMLALRIDFQRLMRFRLASVVEMYELSSPEPRLRIVRGFSPAGIELTDAVGNLQRLAEAQFIQQWSGQVYLFQRRGLDLRNVLAPGKHHPQVENLQWRLNELGYLQSPPSGVFDEATAQAVRRFQRDHSLQVDGTAGPETKIVLYHLVGRPLSEARSE